MEDRFAFASSRIPTLDGWRGVAILMVLVTHFQGGVMRHFFWNQPWLNLGQHGVNIFFVLSGYLITSKLISQNSVNLTQFYLRRLFRLMPVAWLYLLTLVGISIVVQHRIISYDLWGCLFFYRNYLPETNATTCTGHFWSLSIEEQFYAAWPITLVLLGRRRGGVFAALAVSVIAIFRILHWGYYDNDLRLLHTEVHADSLLVGCLLALVLDHEEVRDWLMKWARVVLPVCGVFFIVDVYFYHHLVPLHESVLVALMIGATSLRPAMVVGRVLNWKPLVMMGVTSYSIYVWQTLLLRAELGFWGTMFLPVFAILSWGLIEQPGIELGRKLERLLRSRAEKTSVYSAEQMV